MSNPDKHKPLSAEELFKLLENKSDKATDFEDMDDFEKEALEGFTAHSDPQKAKALSEELNLEISKRVEQTGKGGTKNKIIWFSAAASIALIILVSIFFFNQSKQDLENNLALQEVTEDNKPSAAEEQNAGLETITKNRGNIIVEGNKEQETIKSQGVVNTKNAEKVTSSGLITEPSVAVSENKLSSLSGETGAKDESKSRSENDLDVLQKPAVVLADKTDVKKKEKSSVEQEELAVGNAINQNVTTTTNVPSGYTKDAVRREEADKFAISSKKIEKEKKASIILNNKSKNVDDLNKQVNVESDLDNITSVSTSVSSDVNQDLAYYPGGVLAIKEYVLLYIKSKTTKVIIGNYKVTATAFKNGTLKVNSIIQISKEYCGCTENITEALNTTEKWVPLSIAGFPEDSEVGFTLVF